MISATGEYVLRAAIYLAQHHPESKTTALIAEATRVPSGYLSKVLQSLAKGGVVHSQRGLGGGFTLARNPDQISILDVLQAAGEPVQRIHRCPLGLPGHTSLCPLHSLIDGKMRQVEEAFRSTSLASLLASTDGILPLCDTSIAPACIDEATPRGRARTQPKA